MDLVEWVVIASIVLQFTAAGLAVRMIGVTGRRGAWLLIASAVILMGIRRAISLASSLTAAGQRPLDMAAEGVALVISVLMVLGMFYLKPVFEDAISARKRADVLQERMGRLASLMSEGVVQFRVPCTSESSEADCVVLEANPAFERLIGRSWSDTPNPRLAEALSLSSEHRTALLSVLKEMCASEDSHPDEIVLFSAGRWLAGSFYSLEDGVCIGVLRDMTKERNRNETLEMLVRQRTEDLEKTNAELREANDVKGRFLAAMSHELRTPLNSVIGFTGVLLSGIPGDLNEEQARQLEMVQGSGKRLLALVNDILDLSRIDAGAIDLAITEADINRVAAKTVEYVRPEADRKGIALQLHPCPGECLNCRSAMVDRDKVEQILLNLLSNAVKYTDSGEVRTTIECPTTGIVRVSVSDTGRGIEPAHLERIFDEFEQAYARNETKPPGTGLGLSISRQLARLMGGDIRVSSIPGVGSTFTLELPAIVEAQS